jgi:hypothetical protein
MNFIYALAILGALAPILLIVFVCDRRRVLRRVAQAEEQIGVMLQRLKEKPELINGDREELLEGLEMISIVPKK